MIGAEVHLFDGDTSAAFEKTDGRGRMPLFIPEGEVRDVFVVSRDGSLAVARVASGTAALRLPLLDGASRIVVRTETEAGAPIPRIAVDVRYNGFLLPDEVMASLMGRGSTITSGADGRVVLDHMPSGVYDLGPVVRTSPRRPPVRLVAIPGENGAILTLAP